MNESVSSVKEIQEDLTIPEDSKYSLKELLALDQQIYDISHPNGSISVSVIISDFNKAHGLDEFKPFLEAFGLNIGVYDKDCNKTGMLSVPESNIKMLSTVKLGFLLLCGVSPTLMTEFFGISSKKRSKKNFFSNFFLDKLDIVTKFRVKYPLQCPEEFVEIKQLLTIINNNLGIDPLDIFTEGRIPELHNRHAATLKEVLTLIAEASKGEMTKSNLAQRYRVGLTYVAGLVRLQKNNTVKQSATPQLLSEKTKEILDEKIPVSR